MSERDLFELWLADKRECKSNIRSLSREMTSEILDLRIDGFSEDLITRNEHGKPILEDSPYSFNLSHCGNDYALLLCRQKTCGVDLQRVERREKFDEALQSVFTDREYEELDRKGGEEDFFQLWSVKEAYIKALGGSIWYGRDYDLELIPGGYSDQWVCREGMYIYSTEIFTGKYLSIAVPEKPEEIDFRKFTLKVLSHREK